jgi:hypothetical protein
MSAEFTDTNVMDNSRISVETNFDAARTSARATTRSVEPRGWIAGPDSRKTTIETAHIYVIH